MNPILPPFLLLSSRRLKPRLMRFGAVLLSKSVICLLPEAKAAKFDAKALGWERRGNIAKAHKNRGKVLSFF